jgi:hypothetical protein
MYDVASWYIFECINGTNDLHDSENPIVNIMNNSLTRESPISNLFTFLEI